MPLADFLADIGRGGFVGKVAQASGGRTTQQRGIDDFVNNELPRLAEQISRAQTKADVAKAGQMLIGAGLKAGIPAQGLEKVMGMLVAPALQNLQRGEIDSILKDYGPQPAQPRPQGVEGPLTPGGNFIDPRAGKPIDEAGAIRLNRAFGGDAATMGHLLKAPFENIRTQATAGKTEAEAEALRQRQARLAGIPNVPRESGISLQQLAEFPSLSQVEPQRQRTEDPLLEERRRLLDAQAARAERGDRGSAIMQDYLKLGGDPRDQEAFLKFAESRSGSQTTTETSSKPGDQLTVENEIARLAVNRGTTDAASIKKIAARMGYEIEGEPRVEQPTSIFGENPPPFLSGNFTLRRPPKVVTRGKPGAKQDDNDPLGIRGKR